MTEIFGFLKKLKTTQLIQLTTMFDSSSSSTSVNRNRNRKKNRNFYINRLRLYWSNHAFDNCPICLDRIPLQSIIVSPCCHLFCDTCLITHLRINETCPVCRTPCSYIDMISQISHERLIRVREKCFLPTTALIPTTELIPTTVPVPAYTNIENRAININSVHLFIASAFTLFAFVIHIFMLSFSVYTLISIIIW